MNVLRKLSEFLISYIPNKTYVRKPQKKKKKKRTLLSKEKYIFADKVKLLIKMNKKIKQRHK